MKNLLSPQLYNLTQNGPYFTFQTEQDLIYTCAFQDVTLLLPPLLGIYDMVVRDFFLDAYDSTPEKKRKQDPRISATVTNLIAQHLETPNHVVGYICDSSDGRGKERQTLFARWHRNAGDVYKQQNLRVNTAQGIRYGGLLTRNDFMHWDLLIGQIGQEYAAQKF